MDLYGKTKADKLAEENEVARKILSEINNFGISERQRYLIMYYLSLELEDVENSRSIAELLREVYPDISMTHVYERNS